MLERVLLEACGLDLAKPVVAGVSGGPDSLCLLGILHAAGYRVIVAHFNHGLRSEAAAEAEAVNRTAERMGLQFVTETADVHSHARDESLSLEEAARSLRYRFLFGAARRYAAQAVAVGHTADDQVETVLMHFLRGAGLAGLKGMDYRTFLPAFDSSIPLVRPLLSLWRADTEAYCRDAILEPSYDVSNTDQRYFRNRIRHSLIPELEKYNPRFKETILRTAQALQSDHAVLQVIEDQTWQKAFNSRGQGWVSFDQTVMLGLPDGMRRNLIRRAEELLRSENRDMGFKALDRASRFIESPAARQIDLINGLFLFKEEGKVTLAAYEADLPSANWPQMEKEIVIFEAGSWALAGKVAIGRGWVLNIKKMPSDGDDWRADAGTWSAWLDADKLEKLQMVLRSRRPGDIIRPLGMGGKAVRLQDFYVNIHMPRRARARWPLVCWGEEIAWVPGYRIAEGLRITEETRALIHLEMKKIE